MIKHARKSLQFHVRKAWVKKGGNPFFDVTYGHYDGAEVCELVGLYLFSKNSRLWLLQKTSGFIGMTS